MLTKGMLIKVKTRTKDDVFGEVVWEVVEVGLSAPEPHRRNLKDGVRCIMLGGTGPSARKGFMVLDSEDAIRRNIDEGITEIIPFEKRDSIRTFYDNIVSKTSSGIEM